MAEHRTRISLGIWAFLALVAAQDVGARSGGITSQSGAPGHGTCSSCHSGSGTFDYTPGIPAATVDASSTTQFTLTFTNNNPGNPASGAGFNLSASAGTLNDPNSASGCNLDHNGASPQLTHTAPCTTPSGGPYTWVFTWTAPASGGTQTFYYCARAVNLNGTNSGDAHGDCSTTTITVNPPPGNDPPVVANAIPDQAATEDSPFSFQFAAGTFSDPGDDLTYSAAQPGGGGLPAWLSFTAGTRTFSGTPANANVGNLTVRVTATDTASQSAFDDFVITVGNVNDPPVAGNDSVTVQRNSSNNTLNVLSNDTDVDAGDALTIIATSSPDRGGSVTIAGDGQSLRYTPATDFTGAETFTYTIEDESAATDDATVTVDVSAPPPPPPPNSPPQGVSDSYNVDEDGVLTVAAPGILGNDSDGDGDSLSATDISAVASGILAANSNGSFTYTPASNFNGVDSFTYKASDGKAKTSSVTVSITVAAVDDAPSAMNDSYGTASDTPLSVPVPGVLGNDSDADGDTLTAQLVSGTSNGDVSLAADGRFTYTPDSGYFGTDSFTYRASDGGLDSNIATVTINVSNSNMPPVAVGENYSTGHDTPLSIPAPGVLGNDSDPDGDALTAVLVSAPASGSVGLNADGSFTYTPNSGFGGADSFTYQAHDGIAASNTATVNVDVADPAPDGGEGRGGGGGGSPLTPGLLLPLAGLCLVRRWIR